MILKYNNIIENYIKEFRNITFNFFSLELTIVNNGENNLKNCYILSIRFGDEYLIIFQKLLKNQSKMECLLKLILT